MKQSIIILIFLFIATIASITYFRPIDLPLEELVFPDDEKNGDQGENIMPLKLDSKKWVVYYGSDQTVENFLPYSTIVFDRVNHPPIDRLLEEQRTVLGYISIGEVNPSNLYFNQLKEEKILTTDNPNWEGNQMVDMRRKEWAKLIVEELIPHILDQRFSGIFIDNVDNADYLENLDPVKYKGMKQAATSLIQTIRNNYPQIYIMMNRGYTLIPDVSRHINSILGESVLTTYNFETKEYFMVTDPSQTIKFLRRAQMLNPEIEVFTLDYWYPHDIDQIKQIYKKQYENGFLPYVSVIDLDQVIQEPKQEE